MADELLSFAAQFIRRIFFEEEERGSR